MALSSFQLIARATEVFEANGYQRVSVSADWPESSRVFEDQYGIVAIHVYATWHELNEQWGGAQGLLVDLISANVARRDPKAWDGYLVLLTGADLLEGDYQDLADLRSNTNRLRKLVATGQDLDTLDDVRSVLLPLLPLDVDRLEDSEDRLLSRLPELLEEDGIDREYTEAAIDAFAHNESIMERLHQIRGRS